MTFTFYSSNFFYKLLFTFTQVVLRAITFTLTQVPKKVTRHNTDGYPADMSIFCNLQLGLLKLQEDTP